jgi:hypothetical protein
VGLDGPPVLWPRGTSANAELAYAEYVRGEMRLALSRLGVQLRSTDAADATRLATELTPREGLGGIAQMRTREVIGLHAMALDIQGRTDAAARQWRRAEAMDPRTPGSNEEHEEGDTLFASELSRPFTRELIRVGHARLHRLPERVSTAQRQQAGGEPGPAGVASSHATCGA